MTSKFEQLIEYVINDEEQKARELFHDIVVEKSREIYENLMNEEEEEMDEAKDEEMHEGEELEEAKHDDEEGEELDEAMHDEELEEGMGGDAADDLIDDVEMEEEGMEMSEAEGDEDLEDRVVDLEDKLDELMAEFEAMMGDKEEGFDDDGEEGDAGIHGDLEGDALEMDDTEEFAGSEEEEEGMMEGVDLKAAPAPVKSEEASINKKSTVAANSGAAGMAAHPVKMTGDVAKGRPAPQAKDMGGTTSPKQGPAPKPVTAQAAGVNTKTPFPKG